MFETHELYIICFGSAISVFGLIVVFAIECTKGYRNKTKEVRFNERDNIIYNSMKRTDSLRHIYSSGDNSFANERQRNCILDIPESNRVSKTWALALFEKANKDICQSPYCNSSFMNNKKIYLAYDGKYCSQECQRDALTYIGPYWNLR
jgi:hypothetical protein